MAEEITTTNGVDGVIALNRPIQINGKTIKELTYDMDEITMDLQGRAEAEAKKSAQRGGGFSTAQEIDYGYHTYLGMAAVLAVNPAYDWSDLKRVKGRDLNKFTQIGRSYFFGSEASDEDNSENASEPTAAGTLPA